MSPIEDHTDANRVRAKLEDHVNEVIYSMQQARHYHQHLMDHHGASGFTVRAQLALELVDELEEALVDWEARAEEAALEVPC